MWVFPPPRTVLIAIALIFSSAALADSQTPITSPTVAGKIKCPQYYVCARDGTATLNVPALRSVLGAFPAPVPVPTPTPIPVPAPPPPVAGPGVHNIANAPVWHASQAYAAARHLGDRVLAGPGLNLGATPTYNSGNPLYLLELTQAGTSGVAMPMPVGCPASGIVDGTAVWQCLTPIDYIDPASAQSDDPLQWAPNTAYTIWQIAIAGTVSWQAKADCISGAGGPSSTSTDGTCNWQKIGDVPYSSNHANAWPHVTHTPNNGSDWVTVNNNAEQHFRFWSGGVATGNKYGPFTIEGHQGFGVWTQAHIDAKCPGDWPDNCAGPIYAVVFEPAPSDSICNLPPGSPFRYDPLVAVAIEAVGNVALDLHDSGLTLNCLQIKNSGTDLPAIGGWVWHTNYHLITNSIVDSEGSRTIKIDAHSVIHQSLLINRYAGPGASAWENNYTGALLGNTIVQLGGSQNSIALVNDCLLYQLPSETDGAVNVRNNLIFGFTYPLAMQDCYGHSYNGGASFNNATDTLGKGTYPAVKLPDIWPGIGQTVRPGPILGTGNLYGQSAAAIFVDPAGDWRLAPNSPARGAGSPYSVAGLTNSLPMIYTNRGLNIGAAQ